MTKIKNIVILFLLLIISSCDLTSGLYKEILDAQNLIKERDFEKASIRYKEILNKKPPKNIKVKIYHQLGDIYSTYLNDQVKALHFYNNILKETDDPLWQVKVLEKVAKINFEYLHDFKKSEKSYETLVNFIPRLSKFDLYELNHALSVFNRKDYEKSIELFQNIQKNKKHLYWVDSIYYEGMAYFYLKEWKKSIDILKNYLRYVNDKTKIVEVKFIIANAYETSEKLKEAYNIYYSILGDYPNPKIIKNRLKSLYERRVARKR